MSDNEIRTQVYTVTAADNVRYQIRSYYGRVFGWPTMLFYVLIIFLPPIAMSLAAHHAADGDIARTTLYVMASLALWLIGIPVLSSFSVLASVRKSATSTGWRTTVLTADEIVIEGEGYTLRQAWPVVRTIRKAGRDVYLISHLGAGFIVTGDAFADTAARDAFVSLAKRRIKDANHKQVATFYEAPRIAADLSGLRSAPFRLTFPLYVIYALPITLAAFLRPGALLILLAGFGAVPLWTARERLMAGDWTGPVSSVLTSFLGFMAVLPAFSVVVTWLLYRKKPGFTGERTVSITENEIVGKGDQFDVRVKWRDIRRVTRYLGCMTFWTGPNGGVMIAERAFPDKAAARAFYDQAVTWWKAAKSGPAANSSLDGKG